MELGNCNEIVFDHKTPRNNVCLIRPATIEQISRSVVSEGRALQFGTVEKMRADSIVTESNVHEPTQSRLLYDGLRTIVSQCVDLTPSSRSHHKTAFVEVKVCGLYVL